MSSTKKRTIGIIFAILGGAGIIFGPLLGFTELARPWSFLLGFIFGVMTGIGVALALFGLYEMRR
jgi:branched-subunit amino acid permease